MFFFDEPIMNTCQLIICWSNLLLLITCKNILKKVGFPFYFKVIYLFSYLINRLMLFWRYELQDMLSIYHGLQEQHYIWTLVLRPLCFAEYSKKNTVINQFYNDLRSDFVSANDEHYFSAPWIHKTGPASIQYDIIPILSTKSNR